MVFWGGKIAPWYTMVRRLTMVQMYRPKKPWYILPWYYHGTVEMYRPKKPWYILPWYYHGRVQMYRPKLPWCSTRLSVPWYRYHGARTMVPVPWCPYHGTGTMMPIPWYRYHGTGSVPWCTYECRCTMVPVPWCHCMVPVPCLPWYRYNSNSCWLRLQVCHGTWYKSCNCSTTSEPAIQQCSTHHGSCKTDNNSNI